MELLQPTGSVQLSDKCMKRKKTSTFSVVVDVAYLLGLGRAWLTRSSTNAQTGRRVGIVVGRGEGVTECNSCPSEVTQRAPDCKVHRDIRSECTTKPLHRASEKWQNASASDALCS